MSILSWLFRRKKRSPPIDDGTVSPLVARVMNEIEARAQPCIRMTPGGDGRSRLGGVPDMAGAWPRYKGNALCSVAQLNLVELRAAGGPDWLPDAGRLLFFYDLEEWSWGLDPQDAGSFVVLHEVEPAAAAVEPDDLSEEAKFPAYPVTFAPHASYPSIERIELDWRRLNTASEAALWAALKPLTALSPTHQIGGFPTPVQDDGMELQCQGLAPGGQLEDWRLLLQLDTDDAAGMMWGDVGSLYFWVREQDARAGDFSKVWMILQCH